MVSLDETDLEILRLLVEDGRRPFNDIAERVGVSGPTVSDRVDRLVEEGIIKRFTVELDHDQLVEGVGLIIELEVSPGRGGDVLAQVGDIGGLEHAFLTADDRVLVFARLDPTQAREALRSAVDMEAVSDVDIAIVERNRWSPSFEATGFEVECAECGNAVSDQGRSVVLDGQGYLFCCPSCEDRFVSRYERLRESA